ncbi:hypothetical protein SAMN02745244_00651 [Tessaracoccus bendigoensis DSM 12906]|uniref:Uncharacterized protein n=1 Tax=Tessaracoccus bendigoensis DSM 12906 TaxID=1123357 RepID=A0A1M6CCE6_9ACTN|nr:hypothetical protein [Tessaracoccus bendigoensis]SHI58491.1 hypothetical protein SAMN02745244_00651 [Tessaracoccus bendigoensis DSM 12906]
MSRVTEGYLVRHYQGAKGGRDAALLDIAQDHALHLLHEAGLFDHGLVFKGGTALREQAAIQASCETRLLVGQQAAAFTAGALPLCRKA